ncbi:MAG: Y-family DNA polymerase [Treponema sp.]|nr:Y-family DNA polymerase [Treponema sp.]
MILHADGNSFYASCEQIFRPDLRGKPVAVLSNNDGIIIALNKEAKACGIKRGDPYFKVKDICDLRGITIFSSNYTLYADISRRITSIYQEYAPDIEEYSIDESFLFFDKCNYSIQDWYDIGWELKERIFREIGMPICVGAAPTKTLAKLYNKKAKEHGGVFVYEESKVDQLLANVDCGTIWGIGPARAQKLLQHGIKNALMLKHMPLYDAKRLLTIQGFATVQELNGIATIDKVTRTKKDVITSSRQFSKRIYDINTLECALVQYTELAVERLRQQDCECGAISIYISTCNYYSENPEEQYSNGALVELPRMTSYTPDIVRVARTTLPQLFRPGYGYKTLMVTLMKLLPAAYQGDLWINPETDRKKRRLMDSIDNISKHYGRGTISLAKGSESSGWEMKREFLSPCWTSRFSDFPKIK